MGRRKRATIEDDMDSSDDSAQDYDGQEELNGDERAERELFENPYQQRKRRRLNGKDDATYGIFADEADDEPRYARAGPKKRANTPSFVSKGTETPAVIPQEAEEEDPMDEGEDGESIEEDSSSDSGDDEGDIPVFGSRRKRESVEEDEAEEMPARGLGAFRKGLGMAGTNKVPAVTPESEPEPPRGGGIGFKRGTGLPSTLSPEEPGATPANLRGIGARPSLLPATESPTMSTESLPTSFGASRTQRAFVRATPTQATSIPKTELSAEERAHFAKISGSFGAKMMAKMGWSAGTGLGASGHGIVTPIESKPRPKGNVGIAYGGFKERTKQAIAEDKRRGKVVSDDEDEKRTNRKAKGVKGPEERAEAWRAKQTKRKKVVVEHKTYEEIVQAAGLEPSTVTSAGVGPIIDATGATLREISSLAEVSNMANWTPSTDPTRIPEIRHNVRLIVETATNDVRGLAKEGKSLQERKKYVNTEDTRLRKRITDEAALIERLQRVHLAVDELAVVTKQTRGGGDDALAKLSPGIEKLVKEFGGEYERYGIDEVVVAAVTPAFKATLATWSPLEDPDKMTSILKTWQAALRMSSKSEPDTEIDIYGAQRVSTKPVSNATMTPYEALLWHDWLPKIRSAINNKWDATDAAPAVALFEAWLDLIPPFIQDNIMDQLILPKVRRAISDWKQKHSSASGSLHNIVFAWLPFVGLRMEELLGDAKRRVKGLFRGVEISKGVPAELLLWESVFDPPEWKNLLLKYIVPKLAETLRDDFKVNPRRQDMDPLNWVLAWSSVVGSTIMSQLLETEFFPKWLESLYRWLTAPNASFEDIAQWYERWKDFFPADVIALPGVSNGLRTGLQLMLQASKLGPDVATKLPKPSLVPSARPPSTATATSQPSKKAPRSRLAHEITFKSIAEEFAAEHDLLWVPTGRVHERSRLPMYRVTARADGKSGGAVVYVLDDAVWLVEDGSSSGSVRAITLEEMSLLGAKR